MDINLTPSEMTRLGKEFSLSEKKMHLINQRTTLIKSIQDLNDLLQEESTKFVYFTFFPYFFLISFV